MAISSKAMPNVVFSTVYGAGFFVTLCVVGIYGFGIMPLFPLRLGDPYTEDEQREWALTWLIQTVFDYYGAASCLCSIILATEASLAAGLGWSFLICFLGCPWACIWACIQLYRHGSLGLAGTAAARPEGAPRGAAAMFGLLFLPLYAAFFQVFFAVTWSNQPLVPFNTDDLTWCLWWLMTTCFDYYGCCMVYVAIICATEETPLAAFAWSCGALFVGTPSSCLWVVRRLVNYDTLCLAAVQEKDATPSYLRST